MTTGVYLDSRIIIGDYSEQCGPAGYRRSTHLSSSLKKMGLPMRRFKTGTPMRVLASSVDFSKMIVQKGDENIYPFSLMTAEKVRNVRDCYLTYTNAETHKIILDNLDRSPLYNGSITSTGPRYCPSIETKVVRFANHDRHQIFIEPEGEDTDEMYVQGLSTSLPFDVQERMLHSVAGLENAKIMRYGYAIEYDCLDPLALLPTLAVKNYTGLYAAGQINGSSGYEEAAGQGILAGINAGLFLEGRDPLVLTRDNSYIGVMVDDLVTKGTEEPYRMMTSRAEYRLQLRQDNADERLTEIGRQIGLVDDERYERYQKMQAEKDRIYAKLKSVRYKKDQIAAVMESKGETVPASGIGAEEFLKRTPLTVEDLIAVDPSFGEEDPFLLRRIETEIKYEGYLVKLQREIKEMQKMEKKKLPSDLDYAEVDGLRIEARQRLNDVKPLSLAQASRISGVNPADIVVLMIWLQKNKL